MLIYYWFFNVYIFLINEVKSNIFCIILLCFKSYFVDLNFQIGYSKGLAKYISGLYHLLNLYKDVRSNSLGIFLYIIDIIKFIKRFFIKDYY